MTLFSRLDLRIAAGLGAALALVAASASAVQVAQTSFENEPAFAGPYTDTGDAGADHDLVNNALEPLVDSPPASTAAGDLAFDARYVNSRASVGLTDGDEVGVTADASAVTAYPGGAQGYHLSDADGTAVLEFAPVDLSLTGAWAHLDVFVREADWEPNDRIRVVALLTGAPDQVLLDTSGADIDELAIEGGWRTLAAAIPDEATSVRVRVELESDQAAEAVFLDRVGVLPEPAFGGLLAGALLVAALGIGRAQKRSASRLP